MDPEKFSITAPIEIEKQFLDDLVSCAFEGGINYWCEKAEPADEKSAKISEKVDFLSSIVTVGGSIKLTVKDEGDDPPIPMLLDLAALLKGIQMSLTNKNCNICIFDDYDADDADAIIQYAVFNEIVFG